MKRIFLTILFCATALTARAGTPGKDIYLDLMQKAVEAYTRSTSANTRTESLRKG